MKDYRRTKITENQGGNIYQGPGDPEWIPALQLMFPTSGWMSALQTQLPVLEVGILKPWEESRQRLYAMKKHLTSPTDFSKKLALDCPGQQGAVHLPLLSGQHSDLASLDCISWYSVGSVYYHPSYHLRKTQSKYRIYRKNYSHTSFGRLALGSHADIPKVFPFFVWKHFCAVNRPTAFTQCKPKCWLISTDVSRSESNSYFFSVSTHVCPA